MITNRSGDSSRQHERNGEDLTQYSINDSNGFLHNAISEVSGDFISGNFSSPNLCRRSSPGGNSSDASSDVDIKRHPLGDAGVYASYPESIGESSDNDWNPYTTESDRDHTPRDNPLEKSSSIGFDYRSSTNKFSTEDGRNSQSGAVHNRNSQNEVSLFDNLLKPPSNVRRDRNKVSSVASPLGENSGYQKALTSLSETAYLSLPIMNNTDSLSETTPSGTFYSLQPIPLNDSSQYTTPQNIGAEKSKTLSYSNGKTPKLSRRRPASDQSERIPPHSHTDRKEGRDRHSEKISGQTSRLIEEGSYKNGSVGESVDMYSKTWGDSTDYQLSEHSLTHTGERFEDRHLKPKLSEHLDYNQERTRKGSVSSQDSDALGRKVEHILSDTAHLEKNKESTESVSVLRPQGGVECLSIQATKGRISPAGEKVESLAYRQISSTHLDYLRLQQDLQEIQSSLTNDGDKSEESCQNQARSLDNPSDDRIPSPSNGRSSLSQEMSVSSSYNTDNMHGLQRRPDILRRVMHSNSDHDSVRLNSEGEESRTTGTEDSLVSSTHDGELRNEMNNLHLTEDSEDTLEQYSLSEYREREIKHNANPPTSNLAERVCRILGPEPPAQLASGILQEIGRDEKRVRDLASHRKKSESTADSSMFISPEKASFDHLLTSTKLESSYHPYDGFDAYSNVQTFLSSQLEKASDKTFNHSIEMRSTVPVDIQCYPVYGSRQEQATTSESQRYAGIYGSGHSASGGASGHGRNEFVRDFEGRDQKLPASGENFSSTTRQRERYEVDLPRRSTYQTKDVSDSPGEYTVTERREAQSTESLKSDYGNRLDEKSRAGDIHSVSSDRYRAGLLTSSSLSSGSLSSPSEYDTRLSHRSVDFSGYRPYRPAGSRDVYYIESPGDDNSSVTDSVATVESTHTGSDDAQGPYFPSSVLGSRRDEKKHSPVVYPSRKQPIGGNDGILSTIEEKSVDGADSGKQSSSDTTSIKSYERTIDQHLDDSETSERMRQADRVSARLMESNEEPADSRMYEIKCSAEFYEPSEESNERGEESCERQHSKVMSGVHSDHITHSEKERTKSGLPATDRKEIYKQDTLSRNPKSDIDQGRRSNDIQYDQERKKQTSQNVATSRAGYHADVDEIIRRYTGEPSVRTSVTGHYSDRAGDQRNRNWDPISPLNSRPYSKTDDLTNLPRRERSMDINNTDMRSRQGKEALSKTEASHAPPNLSDMWNQFQELNQDDSGSSWNSSRMDSVKKLLKNPVGHLSHIKEDQNSYNTPSPQSAKYDQKRKEFMERTKRGASDEEANGSYIDAIPSMKKEMSKANRNAPFDSPAKSETSQYSSPERSVKTDYTVGSRTDISSTLYSIAEDSQRDSLSLNTSPPSITHINTETRRRHLIDPHMKKLKEKIKKQRDKLDKGRWKEIHRMEKLRKLECLRDAKKKGKITSMALTEELGCISSTSTALSSNDSTLLSSEPNKSVEMQVEKRSADHMIFKSRRPDPRLGEKSKRLLIQQMLDESETLSEDDRHNLVNLRKSMTQSKNRKKSSKASQQSEPPFKTQRKQYEKQYENSIDDELASLILPKHKNIQTSPRRSHTQEVGTMYPSPTKSPHSKYRGISKSIQTTPGLGMRNRASSPSRDNTGVITVPHMSPDRNKQTSSPSYKTKPIHTRVSSHSSRKTRAHSSPKSKHHSPSRSVQSSPQRIEPHNAVRRTKPQSNEKENLPNPVAKMFQPESNGESSVSQKEKPIPNSEVSGIAWFVPLKEDSRSKKEPLKERQVETVRQAWEPDIMTHRQQKDEVTRDSLRKRLEPGDIEFKQPSFVGVPRPEMELTTDSEYPLPLHKMTLQDAFLIYRRDVVSRSRERQKKILLASEERRLQAMYQREREEILNLRSSKHTTPSTVVNHPICDNLYRPVKRSFSKKEMKEITNRLYNTLPEVLEQDFRKKVEEENKLNRIKAKRFNRKVQRHVLRKAGVRYE